MRCRHCFARFTDAGHDNLPHAEMLAVIRELALGFERVNFVGGEPTLCRWLVDGLQVARDLGLRTSLVTNGTRLIHSAEQRGAILSRIDWLGLSIDSANRSLLPRVRQLPSRPMLGRPESQAHEPASRETAR
jgi:radical S-adenosyl methionine domain-containing protein 2